MSKIKELAEWALGKCGYNDKGEEIPDPRPLEIPIGFERPPDLMQIMGSLLRQEVQKQLSERGIDTFEDANDFDTGDDDPSSPWEDPELQEAFTREAELRAGAVEEPDWEGARRIVKKVTEYMDKFDQNGNLKEKKA